MTFDFFSRNGNILPVAEAKVPLSNIEYSYGFGVYESIRVSNGVTYFLEEHIERLLGSARTISLEHPFSGKIVSRAIGELLAKNGAETCNVKILLIGGRATEEAEFNILCLNPLFPDKKMYRDGVACVTYEYERPFPHAKTLNMLQSYLAYRKAKEADAYDALLINKRGCITEGTRTNFFCMKGKTLFSPNENDILLGVTRKVVIRVAAEHGFEVIQKDIYLKDLPEYDGAFLTSTSSGIMPVASIGGFKFGAQPPALKGLIDAFDAFIADCGGKL